MTTESIEKFRNDDYEEFIAGLEAMDFSAVALVGKHFSTYHSKLKLAIEGTYRGLMDITQMSDGELSAKPAAFRMRIQANYYDLMERIIYAPAGLSVTYPEFVEGLDALRETSLGFYTNQLNDLEFWFSRLTNAVDLLRSASVTSEIDTNISEKTRASAHEYGLMFSAKNMKDRGPVSDYFEKKSQIEEVYRKLAEMKTDREYPSPKAVIERVNRLNEVVAALVKNIEALDSKDRPNKRTMSALYEATMSVAEIVELMGLFYAERQKAIVAFEQSLVEMKK